MPRLFAGLELPPDANDALARLKHPIPGARWLDPHDYHLTLRFFGDIDGRAARDLVDHLAAIDRPIFPVTLKGLGTFGSKEPSALWAAVEASDALNDLQRAVERAARLAGLAPETRGFRAHVTLARLRRPRPEALARFLGHQGGFACAPFVVPRFVLYSAKPHVGGGPYVAEQLFPLQGGDWDEEDDEDSIEH